MVCKTSLSHKFYVSKNLVQFCFIYLNLLLYYLPNSVIHDHRTFRILPDASHDL